MITIGTIRFEFQVGNEDFAQNLHANWNSFFSTSFEKVADEVLSAYDIDGQVITITSLPLDLGKISEEEFERQFPLRLREVLGDYAKKYLVADNHALEQTGICKKRIGESAYSILCFFLLHGYFPYETDREYTDLHFILSKVISESAYQFKEFLNAYGHYDFICQRLIFNYSDEELEQIVHMVQPAESKFINLYIRVQIRSFEMMKRPDIGKEDYRNAVWILVLAYLFSESRAYFSRKQLIVHTLQGISAHFNFTFAELTTLLTESVRHLEQTSEQLPEFWTILKEIRQDLHTDIYALNGDYRKHLLNEILFALRASKQEDVANILSYEHLILILLDPHFCHELLSQLQEFQIHRLVGAIIPSEKDYIISYADLLEHRKEVGTFTGKIGTDFKLLKWEFIMIVLISSPASAFSKKLFILSVLQRLAAHYNLKVNELIHLFVKDLGLTVNYLTAQILSVLEELDKEMNEFRLRELNFESLEPDEWGVLLSTPEIVRKIFTRHSESQISEWVLRLSPLHGEFIVGYASLLEKGHEIGWLEGKAGSEFRILKWEFVFACLLHNKGVAFHQKMFVYAVLKRLADHYNQDITELISYFAILHSQMLEEPLFRSLKNILDELFQEHMNPLYLINKVRGKTDSELKLWVEQIWNGKSSIRTTGSWEPYQEKWLIYLLNERQEMFRSLWKSGQLNSAFVLRLVNHSASLRNLWLRRIGDERLLNIYRNWRSLYSALCTHLREFTFLTSIGEYLSVWIVELTAPTYSSWSETEIFRFLVARMRQSLPAGFTALLNDIHLDKAINITEILNQISELKKEEIVENLRSTINSIEVENAGLVLMYPFLGRLFYMLDYLNVDRRDFKDESSQIRAIFLMQYIIYGDLYREYRENELTLNKLLVNRKDQNPLPRRLDLTDKEMSLVKELLQNVKQLWEKVKNTSDEGIRQSFFQRNGILCFDEEKQMWLLKIEERAFDILLDSLPWSYKIIRMPWMENMLEIKWR